MLPIHIALTTLTNRVSHSELSEVAAALQKQVTRDFGPIWRVHATVDAFPADHIPSGYWPIFVQDSIDVDGALGYHETNAHGIPYALVLYGSTWSLTASHECLEMLGDPTARRVRSGLSPITGQGRVEFLVEVCDPCEAGLYAYGVNGVPVSDFYTPRFFDPVVVPGGHYSFTGAIEYPLQVLRDGYLSWFAQDGLIYQARADGDGTMTFTDGIDPAGRQGRPLREFVDALTPKHHHRLSNAVLSKELLAAGEHALAARSAHSARIMADIRRRFSGQ